MTDRADLLPGTLDVLILKAVSLGRLHGYGEEEASWKRLVAAMTAALNTTPQEV